MARPLLPFALVLATALALPPDAHAVDSPAAVSLPGDPSFSGTARLMASGVLWTGLSRTAALSGSVRLFKLFEAEGGAGLSQCPGQDGHLLTIRAGVSPSVYSGPRWNIRIPVLGGYHRGVYSGDGCDDGFSKTSLTAWTVTTGIDATDWRPSSHFGFNMRLLVGGGRYDSRYTAGMYTGDGSDQGRAIELALSLGVAFR